MTREKSTAELVYEFPVEPEVLATIVKRSAAETNRVSARANRSVSRSGFRASSPHTARSLKEKLSPQNEDLSCGERSDAA